MKPLEIGDRVKVRQGSCINYKGAVTWVCVASVHVRLDCKDCELAFHSSQLTRLVKKKNKPGTVTITKEQLAKALDKIMLSCAWKFSSMNSTQLSEELCKELGFNE